jgi:hypothetical protein
MVEVRHFGTWERAEIVARVSGPTGEQAVWQLIGFNEWASCYEGGARPIRSEREKAVEEMMQEAGYSDSDCYVSDYHVVALVVEAIYDAGYRKTEGE